MSPYESKKDKSMRIINALIKELDLSIRQFAKSIGFSYMQVYYVTVGKTKSISEELANAIVNAYPQVSMTYLTDGTGSMFVDTNEEEEPQETNQSISPNDAIQLMNRVMDYLDKVQAREDNIMDIMSRTLELQETLTEMLVSRKE